MASYVYNFIPASPSASEASDAGTTPNERPTLVLFHGTGGDENSLMDLAATVHPSANRLGIRGQSTEEGVNRFFRRLSEGVFDEADVLVRAEEISQFLTAFCLQQGLTGPLIAIGYSNGANIAAAILLTHRSALKGAAILRGVLPLEPPIQIDLIGKRVLICSGEGDPMAPADRVNDLVTRLRTAGASVTEKVMPTGHNLGRGDVDALQEWMQPYLPA